MNRESNKLKPVLIRIEIRAGVQSLASATYLAGRLREGCNTICNVQGAQVSKIESNVEEQ